MSRLGDRPSFLRLVRFVAAGLLIGLGLTLSATSLSGYWVVHSALNTVVRGQGEALLHTIGRTTKRGTRIDDDVLKGLLDNEAPRGLRCLALFESGPGATPVPVAATGRCLTPQAMLGDVMAHQRSDELIAVGDRMRMVLGLPPVPPASPTPLYQVPPQGTPPPPGAPWPVQPGEPDEPAGPAFPGPPPSRPETAARLGEPAKWQGPRPILIEFEPQMAEQLRQSAHRTLLSGAVATLALIIAAAIFWHLSSREERAYATQERQRQLASLGEMAAVLAHELRNPLAALKGHAQLLVEQLPTGSRPHDKASRVVSEAERLEALSEDLLSFVRTTVIEPQTVSPADLLAECASLFPEGRVEVATERAPSRWRLDPERMRQVLGNLLRNAVEASPPEGKVLASARGEGDELVFAVRDHGKGLQEQDMEKIFEPFFTTRARGTGLGLPIARRLVALHGGSITAGNASDGGALFTVRLPARTPGESRA